MRTEKLRMRGYGPGSWETRDGLFAILQEKTYWSWLVYENDGDLDESRQLFGRSFITLAEACEAITAERERRREAAEAAREQGD
jgi:hypothetical protein